MKTTVYIPTIPEHFGNISTIIEDYSSGTERPDEIIVFLSRSREVSMEHQYAISRHPSKLVTLVKSPARVYAGPARQQAQNLAHGDVVLYQDSDDRPHPYRVEWVKRLFETRDCMVVNHSYFYKQQPTWDFEWKNMRVVQGQTLRDLYFPNEDVTECRKYTAAYGGGCDFPVHAGVVCIRRELLNEIRWKHPDDLVYAPDPKTKTEDYEFCMDALFKVNRSIVVDAPLYYYAG